MLGRCEKFSNLYFRIIHIRNCPAKFLCIRRRIWNKYVPIAEPD
ncbi:hypothetical protein FICKIIDM_01976 [Xanthomonas citri pv. punicae]|nr:hypothetical protein FICKIIDM_01976 [Xanthomonas citri pv. punicae]